MYIMKLKLSVLPLVALLLLACPAFSQNVLSIDKLSTSDPKAFIYIANYPMTVKESNEKLIMLAMRFTSDKKTDSLTGMSGLQLFATGLGKCFLKDTLTLLFKTGETLKLTATSPEFCDQQLSAWFDMKKEDLATLFSTSIIQVNFKNSKTGEIFTQDVTDTDQQQYFIELKKVFDTMVPPKKQGS